MKSTKQRVAVICILLLAVGWWWQSWNFDDRFVAGEYVAENSGECNGLVLNSDHSFSEEVWKDDRSTTPTTGTWRRFGQAGVALSKSFIGATPKAIANDNVYGMLDNTFGFHTLTIDPQTTPIKFHKKFVHLRACAW